MNPAAQPTATKKRPSETDARVPEMLGRFVADTYVLYFQTQSFHWNVRGPNFASLHQLFGAQYEELAVSIDELAERVRALGALAPTSLSKILEARSLDADHGAPAASEMVAHLRRAHEHMARAARDGAELADEAGDPATNDMLVGRAAAHDKAAWMLRATLEV